MTSQLLPFARPATILFWTAAVICLIAHGGILRSLLRTRERRASEIAWAVLPAVALAAVLFMTWRSMHAGV